MEENIPVKEIKWQWISVMPNFWIQLDRQIELYEKAPYPLKSALARQLATAAWAVSQWSLHGQENERSGFTPT
ncbi:MAG TPA: hypothetical protein V6D07_18690 [Trichocoleus sp.]